MKKFLLLGLAALGLVALAPTESKADDGFRIYIGPAHPHGIYLCLQQGAFVIGDPSRSKISAKTVLKFRVAKAAKDALLFCAFAVLSSVATLV